MGLNKFEDFTMRNYKWQQAVASGSILIGDTTNISNDRSFGKNTSSFYLQLGEAF